MERLGSPCRSVTDLAEPAFIATAIKVRLGFRQGEDLGSNQPAS